MVKLKESARFTAVTGSADECALALVPLPDRTADRRWDVAATGGRPRPGGKCCPRGLLPPGVGPKLGLQARASPQLSFLEINDQGVERPVEHLSDIP